MIKLRGENKLLEEENKSLKHTVLELRTKTEKIEERLDQLASVNETLLKQVSVTTPTKQVEEPKEEPKEEPVKTESSDVYLSKPIDIIQLVHSQSEPLFQQRGLLLLVIHMDQREAAQWHFIGPDLLQFKACINQICLQWLLYESRIHLDLHWERGPLPVRRISPKRIHRGDRLRQRQRLLFVYIEEFTFDSSYKIWYYHWKDCILQLWKEISVLFWYKWDLN